MNKREYKLFSDDPIFENMKFEYIDEKTGSVLVKKLYLSGPMIMFDEKNRNGRIYESKDCEPEINRYIKEFVNDNRAYGELNHPEGHDIDLQKACLRVTELKKDGNYYNGKARVLSTPMGKILECLINDDCKVGMSTRALGKVEEKSDASYVKDMRLIAIDCVADPSAHNAFVNGILESKSFILNDNGKLEPLFNSFERSIASLPKKHRDTYVSENVFKFINALKNYPSK